jgi:hypothetical protein
MSLNIIDIPDIPGRGGRDFDLAVRERLTSAHPSKLPIFTTQYLETLTPRLFEGYVVRCSNGRNGEGCLAYCDGFNWKMVELGLNLSYSGSKAQLLWTKITANGVVLTKGGTASTVDDLQTANDTNIYHIDEVNDEPHIDLVVDFVNVTAFSWVQIIGGYEGVTSHMVGVQVEITPFDGSAWYNYQCMDHHGTLEYLEDYSFFVPNDSIHINAGVVKVRFVHTIASQGSTQHDLEFDVVALYK